MDLDRSKRIMTLALPIIGGMVSQNVLNLVDTAMVGHLGDAALAAVGFGGFATFMATAFITGLSSGVQAMASRRLGEGREDAMAIPLNGGLLLALGLALPMTALMITFAPGLLAAALDDPKVVEIAAPYVQVRMLGIAAIGANYAFRGYWNGVNLSRLYMRTLVVMHAVNIALNYVLIFGKLGAPALGATGAGLATTISVYVGTLYYVIQALIHARHAGFARGLPDGETVRTMLKLAVPAGLMQLFFATGMTTFFWIVGKVGTQALAASNVLVNILLVALLPGMGFGLASASLVGQALGRKDVEDAERWGWDVAKLAMIAVGLIALPAVIAPDPLLGVFIHNPDTLALARTPLRLIAATIALDVGGNVLLQSLLGAGDTRRAMIVTISAQWLVGLPLMYLLGVHLGWGLLAIWAIQSGYRGLQGVVFAGFWRGRRWAQIKV